MRIVLVTLALAVAMGSLASARTIYVSDWVDGKVWRSSDAPGSTKELVATGAGHQQMIFEKHGIFLVADPVAARVRRYTTLGELLSDNVLSITVPGVQGLGFDSAGKLWVTAYDAGAIYRFVRNAGTGGYDLEATVPLAGLGGAQYITVSPAGVGGPEVLWIPTQGSKVLRYNPATAELVTIDQPTYNGQVAYSPNKQWLYLSSALATPGHGGLRAMHLGIDTSFGPLLWDGGQDAYPGLVVDDEGKVFLCDFRNDRVAVFTGADTGTPTFSHWLFEGADGPNGIAIEPDAVTASTVYAADWVDRSIWRSGDAADSTKELVATGSRHQQMVFEKRGVFLVADPDVSKVRRYSTAGELLSDNVLPSTVANVQGLGFDSEGKLWVSSADNSALYRYAYNAGTEGYDLEKTVTGLTAYPQYITAGPLGAGGPEVIWLAGLGGKVYRYNPATEELVTIDQAGYNVGLAYSPDKQWLYLSTALANWTAGGLKAMRPGIDTSFGPLLWNGYTDAFAGLAVDSAGTIFLSDFRNDRVAVFTGANTGTPTFSHWLFQGADGPNGIAIEPPEFVPQPTTLAALGLGALGLVGFALRRRK